MNDTFFFSAPQLKRDPLGSTIRILVREDPILHFIDWFFVASAVLIAGVIVIRAKWRTAARGVSIYVVLGIALLSLRDALRLENSSLLSWAVRLIALVLLVAAYVRAQRRPSLPGAA